MPGWESIYQRHRKSSYSKISKQLITWLWQWRQAFPDLYRHPLARFIRRVVSCYRRQQRRIKRQKKRQRDFNCWWMPEQSQSLHVSLPVFAGYPWEAEIYDNLCEMVANTGEQLVVGLSLAGDAVPKTRVILQNMAEGFGLLLLLHSIIHPEGE